MATLGESEIIVASTMVGTARILHIFADSTLFPRLGLTIGISLHEHPTGHPSQPSPASAKYEMREASGELRLYEHTEALGAVLWAGAKGNVRSSPYVNEHQLRFTCDLDYWRLEQIEKRRAGGSLKLWLQLWPTIVADGKIVGADIRAIELNVPREQWLEFYSRVSATTFELLEIAYAAREAEHFQRALGRLQEARAQISAGDYDKAVALCRNVLEALGQEIPAGTSTTPLETLLADTTDERRAKEYYGIVARIKQLAGFVHHELGAPVIYSRVEAQFLVRLTESVVAMIGGLTARAQASQ